MKNIILLSDGTGNSAAKRHKTNVWRLYQALDLDDPDKQIAFYNDGVGSQQFLPFKLMGNAFGWGLKRNVIELYITLCRVYNQKDKIYLFGFSRGAFTVRMLAGLIARCGLYTEYKDEDDLRQTALDHFIAYRSRYKKGWVHRLWRWMHRLWRRVTDPKKPDKKSEGPDIEFIGAWDTVDAYGLPVYELASLWDYVIWPLRFVDQKLPKNARRACHALSIDDERVSFRPLLWDERTSQEDTDKGKEDGVVEGNEERSDRNRESAQIEQVWFAGVHADVGGGYPRNELALVALDWMISKVEARAKDGPGLRMIPALRQEYRERANWHGVQHDSRSGVRAYYRYKPRDIKQLWKNQAAENPKIHISVPKRIKKNIVPYAPTALPEVYDVVNSLGEETDRYKSYDNKELDKAHAVIQRRQWLYMVFVLASLTFVFLPLFVAGYSPDECVGWYCLGAVPFRLATCVLPDCAVPWVEVWIDVVQNPWGAWAIVLTVLALRHLKIRWFSATRKHAMAAWADLKKRS